MPSSAKLRRDRASIPAQCLFPVLLILLPLAASGQIPARFNAEGRLFDPSTQGPLEGNQTISVRLFKTATEGEPIYHETHDVTLTDGRFQLVVGGGTRGEGVAELTENALTPPLYLEFEVQGNVFTPRQEIPPVPFAVGSKKTEALPPGLIAFFASDCPPGWSRYGAASGRFILALPDAGTVEQTHGSQLADGGDVTITGVATHAHSVDPAPFNVPHALGVGGIASGVVDENSTGVSVTTSVVAITPTATAASDPNGNHSHTGTTNTQGGQVSLLMNGREPGASDVTFSRNTCPDNVPYFRNFNTELVGASDVDDCEPMSGELGDAWRWPISNQSHSHSVIANADGSHDHTIPATSLASALTGTSSVTDPTHSHGANLGVAGTATGTASVNVPATTSSTEGSPSVDVPIPYIQLTACMKN